MKKIFSIITIFAVMFLINSCRSDGEMAYTGDSLLLFTAGQSSADAFVIAGTGSTAYSIPFGILKQSDTDNNVTLVVDQAKSTAKEGVDYTIANKTVTLKAGATSGVFPVKLLEGGAVQSGKTIVFTLSSPTLKNASFNQDFTLNASLTCPISSFVGAFKNTEAWWQDSAGLTFDVETSNVENQLLVKDFWDEGSDLVLNYNPDTFVVTVPDQNSGVPYNATANVWGKASTTATEISSFNPCTRKMTLYINYYVPGVGGWGNQKEVFVGQ